MSFLKNKQLCNIIMIFICIISQSMQVRCYKNLKFFMTNKCPQCLWNDRRNIVRMGYSTSSVVLIYYGVYSKIQGKEFLIVFKKIYGERRKFLSLYPLPEKTSRTMPSKAKVFTIRHDLIFEPFDSQLPSAVCQEACNITAR